ncbi:MAG: chitobiase/beta-hexosaminidase C-terminal domain-containing protein [Lachnospiraceae bacterium]|nr:chitobiase/beta-hexosaminidase C-terminal domain-containing protein [Lachnospiraceae bacterium]
MKRRSFVTYLLTLALTVESTFSASITSLAAGDDEPVVEAEAEEVVTEEEAEEETAQAAPGSFVYIEKIDEEEKGSSLTGLMGNLDEYQPEGVEARADGMQLPVTGINVMMPSEGDVNTLVIMTEFADKKFKAGFKEELQQKIFMPDSESSKDDPLYPFESLRAYYQRASFGTLDIQGDIIDYVSEHERSWYDSATGSNDVLYQEVLDNWAKQIVSGNAADSGISDLKYLNDYLAKFDANGDMCIDGCYLAVAGGNTGWSSQWWAYRTGDSRIHIGDYTIPAVIQVLDTYNEESGLDDVTDYLNTFVHETGHQLGLDDYYSYESDMAKINSFAMMSNNLGDQDGFAKMLLGWIPEEKIQWVTTDSDVVLDPYAESGSIAVILPAEEKEAYGVYSQFILAEYYTSTKNDVLPDWCLRDPKVQPADGLRLFHVYAHLAPWGAEFASSNRLDYMIPLIENYRCASDERFGFFREGDSLLADGDPSSVFYEDSNGYGYLADCTMVSSGISITDINTKAEGGTLSFHVDFDDGVKRPEVKSCRVGIDEDFGGIVEVIFDQSVNINKDMAAEIYDVDPFTLAPAVDENWEAIWDIRRDYRYESYSHYSDRFYFMLDPESVRMTDAVLYLPKGMISSAAGVAANDLLIPFSFVEGAPELTLSKLSGVYDDAFDLTVSGAPEGSVIRYTLDGTEPEATSAEYKEAIKIENSAVFKAQAFTADGFPATKRTYAQYLIEKAVPERTELTLSVGEYFKLNAAFVGHEEADPTLYYESSDTSVVSIKGDNLLLARKKGNADIIISTAHQSFALCKVTVVDEAAPELTELLKAQFGNEWTDVAREISLDLGGTMTLAEFYAGGYTQKRWVGYIDDVCYSGKNLKPDMPVYDGIKKLEAGKDYKLTYKKNKNAGTAEVKVKFKGNYKKEKAQKASFIIRPANVYEDLVLYTCAVQYTGKAQKPQPCLVWPNGEKVKISSKDFDVMYYDHNGKPVNAVKDGGVYFIRVMGKNNFTGYVDNYLQVKDKNVIEKLKVKKKKGSLSAEGGSVKAVYGKDYTIKLPKGYDPITDAAGNLNTKELDISFVANEQAGKVYMIITDTHDSELYFGTQVVTFKLKKSKKK